MKIEVTNTKCKILDRLDMNQLAVIQSICSFKVEGSEFKAQAFKNYKRGRGKFEWDGYKKLFSTQHQTFPIGLLSLVRNTLQNYGVPVEIVNSRKAHNCTTYHTIKNYDERDYQNDAVMTSIMYGNGIVKAATGSGKTTIAARTIGALNKEAIFVVHTRDLLYQTKEAFQRMFPNEDIGQIGDGVIDYQSITVATMQTLAILGGIKYDKYKYDEDYVDNEDRLDYKYDKTEWNQYRNSVGVVMYDEVQRICSQTAYGTRFMFEKAPYAFGYSASPWRDDGSDLMIEAAFGSRIVDIDASSLIRQGFLVKPIITIKPVKDNVWSGKTYEQVYKSAIVENIFRNIQVVEDATEQYELGRNTLVLVTQIKHGEMLEKMLNDNGVPASFISGKSGMKKRRQTIQDMRDGHAPIVIASTIADVGLDVPRLQSVIEAGAGKSSVTALQRVGRIMRPFNGKDLCYFTTYEDTAPHLCWQVENKIKIWKEESEFVINRE